MLFDFLPQITDSSLERPLGGADWGTNTKDLLWQMDQGVHARLDKVDPRFELLAVYHLEFLCKRCQCELSVTNIILSNPMLVHEAHSKHKLAVIGIISVGKDAQKKTRAKTIQILQKFPSLVPTG